MSFAKSLEYCVSIKNESDFKLKNVLLSCGGTIPISTVGYPAFDLSAHAPTKHFKLSTTAKIPAGFLSCNIRAANLEVLHHADNVKPYRGKSNYQVNIKIVNNVMPLTKGIFPAAISQLKLVPQTGDCTYGD